MVTRDPGAAGGMIDRAGSPKRLRERAGIFAAPLDVVGLVCGVTIGVLGLISAAATDGVRIGLMERSGTDIAYRQGPRLGRAPVRRWDSWRRHTTLVMLAHAILAVIAGERANHHDQSLIPLSLNEIRRLLAKLAINAVGLLRWL